MRHKLRSLRKLVDAFPDFFWCKDRDGRFTEANHASATFLMGPDATVADLIGKTDFDLYPDEKARAFRAEELSVMETGQALINQRSGHGGRDHVFLSSKYPLRDEQGNTVGIIGIARNASEVSLATTRELEASRMEATATLAGGIAHKVNNLMAIIMCSTSMLSEKEDREEYAVIHDAAEEAGELAHNLLAFSRQGKWLSWSLDLNEIIREALAFERDRHGERITVETDLADGEMMIEGDPRQVNMVLMTLLRNAEEAIESEGHLRVTTREVTVTTATDERLAPDTYVRMDVEDTGHGMDERTMARVFEPFFSTRFHGRGMSLAAAHGILTNHGGTITVKSRPGKGSVFSVYFPRVARKRSKASRTQSAAPENGNGTLMIVDDDELVRTMFAKLLEHHGYNILTAANGKEAVAILDRNKGAVDLAILDLEMPVMDGITAYPKLKGIHPDLKVLVCSGYGAEADARKIISPEDAYVEKPVPGDRLCAEVKRLLN